MVVAPPPTRDSAVSPCFHGCQTLLHRHCPPPPPPSHPLGCPRPGIAPQSLNSSSQPLHLPGDQRSCPGYVWLRQGLSDSNLGCCRSAVVFSALRELPRCGDRTPASLPSPSEGRSSPTDTPVFPPSSFISLSFAWFYTFFSTGQVLLSTLSWRSACTSVSEGVFLMYCGERCTPCPPTSPQSCLALVFITATQICGRLKQPENT